MLNETLSLIHDRRSVRAYEDRPIDRALVDKVIQAAMRAPTAGNMMLYSILEIEDQAIKDKLAESCDHQTFIATAPLVLLFLADYQRWWDFFVACDVETYCQEGGRELRRPGEGDLLLACCDALIAAQTAVIAAEALGLGSCYIGDIMENYEYHSELLHLHRYTFPVTMVCFGYPTPAAAGRTLTSRFPQQMIHHHNGYRRVEGEELLETFAAGAPPRFAGDTTNAGQRVYDRKFGADFSVEMTRSVRAAIRSWVDG